MDHQIKTDRMKELVALLKQASKAYYADNTEIMSNFEYDKLYDELVILEQETGITLSDSPTVNVGYESVDELPKERHEKPMLSLGKTKSREELQSWLNGKDALLSWKLDGLTVVLTYDDGKLAKAVTRGNGEVGEVITNNAKTFRNLPLVIAYKGKLIIRGEAVIKYSDFEEINRSIPEADAKYKNPRNLCSGSVRQLNNEITAKRKVHFMAFSLVQADAIDFHNSLNEQYEFLNKMGFEVVDHLKVTETTILEAIRTFENRIETEDIPSDGLVLSYDDLSYGAALGRTAKFPRNAIAFKWADEVMETTLREIEWSPSRTGLINPVAIFDSVELEGTSVSRASVHNLSIMKTLQLGIGDKITVYKANMIIPQIAENLTRSDYIEIPKVCPVCGGQTQIKNLNDTETLYCANPDCTAKKIKAFTLFVSRDAINIDGLSEATLEKFIGMGFIHEFADLFHLSRYKDMIVRMEGFGLKSYQNLMDSIEKARTTNIPKFIYSLGIPNVGLVNAKMLCKHFNYNYDALMKAEQSELSEIDHVGDVIASSFYEYMNKSSNIEMIKRLIAELQFEKPTQNEGLQNLTGLSFVITGSLEHYENRDAMKEEIEKRGGKVTGSVTSKTTSLINNDVTSSSSKNKTAKQLGIPIISEEDFMNQYLQS